MNFFEKNGFYVERNAISKESAKLLANDFDILRNCIYHVEQIESNDLYKFRDGQAEKCFSWYSPFCFESLLVTMLPKIEFITGKTLYPCYSYGRIYYHGSKLVRHIDRFSCEYSVTMTIDIDDTPWDIHFNNRDNQIETISLDIGDMCVYKGAELYHWRDTYKGNRQVQAFLHYVDANGDFSNYKYDTRPLLGLSNGYRNYNYDLIT